MRRAKTGNPRKTEEIILAAGAALEAVLLVVILAFEFADNWIVAVRQVTVGIALALSIVIAVLERKRPQIFLAAAMAFTFVSDVFLVLLDDRYLLAVSLFAAAQILHFVRIALTRKAFLGSLLARIAVSGALIGALAIARVLSPLFAAGSVYAVNLVFNLIDSALSVKREKRMILSLVGFALFALCDVTVGLNGIGRGLGIPETFLYAGICLTWAFYLPSQVLIVFSGSEPEKPLFSTLRKRGKEDE